MPIYNRLFVLFFTSCLSALVMAQPREMIAGQHYATIDPPVATQSNADTIEILDVFWYGCPLCREFEPMMTYYGGEIRGDLTLRRMPAIWTELMHNHAQVYYTAVALGIENQAHPAAFSYVQSEHMPLNTAAQAQQFFSTLGVAADDFEKAWQSEEVKTALLQAQADTAQADIERVPALIVHGRYSVVRSASVPELTEVVVTANQLIGVLRKERRKN